MTEPDSGWNAPSWEGEESPKARLPRVEDLPAVDGGYDREAVEQAFNEFYRHAAQLDTTLRMLESFDAFQKQAADLRSDLRSLRGASAGAPPAPRATWTTDYRRTYPPPRLGPELPEAFPRVAVEAAFIILVAVAAAIAGLSTAFVVGLVLAAWLVVGLAEIVASAARPSFRRPRASEVFEPAVARPAVEAEPVYDPVVRPAGESTMLDLAAAEAEGSEPQVVEPAEPEPEAEVEPPAEPEAVAPEPESEPQLKTTLQQSVASEAEAVAEPVPPRRRWRRRRRQVDVEPEPLPSHVRVIPSAGAAEAAEAEVPVTPEALVVDAAAAEAVALEEEPEAGFHEAVASDVVEMEGEPEPDPQLEQDEVGPRDPAGEPAAETGLEVEDAIAAEPQAAVDVSGEDAGPEPQAETEEPEAPELAHVEAAAEEPAAEEVSEDTGELPLVAEEPDVGFVAADEPEQAAAYDPWLDDAWPDVKTDAEDDGTAASPAEESEEPRRRWWRRRRAEPVAEAAAQEPAPRVRLVDVEQVVEPESVEVPWDEPERELASEAEPVVEPEPEPESFPDVPVEAVPEPEPEPELEPEPVASVAREPVSEPEPELEAEPEPVSEPEPEPEPVQEPEPEPQPAALMGRTATPALDATDRTRLRRGRR
jgi:hypothetical protein